jgi:hypothetical protein
MGVAAVAEPSVLPRPPRARPWDAGPEATARDVAALRFVGEQCTVRLDVLAVLLGRLSPAAVPEAGRLGERTVRQRVERWEQAGWAERRRMLGHTWVLVTRAGLRLAGLELDPWTPALDRLAHHHAAAIVRVAREPVPGRGGWVCERELWRRRGRASWHMVDGALPAPVPADWQGIDQAWELVEVELTHKARPRVLAAVKTRPPHTAAITYYVPAALHAPLSALLAGVVRELGGRPPVTVEPLPQVPGVTYLAAGGEAARAGIPRTPGAGAAGTPTIPAGAGIGPPGAGGTPVGRWTTTSSATTSPPAAHPRPASSAWPWPCSCSYSARSRCWPGRPAKPSSA